IASWGSLGHRAIAYLAEIHPTSPGYAYIQQLLRDRDISDAAIWADFYKYTPPGWHTSSWHFINAHDNPPNSCRLELEQDCSGKEMCIITAISNMVSIFLSQSFHSPLKFLLHLIRDLHNPLYVKGLAKEGNNIKVLFKERRTNLHFLWD
ncbi:phospholipase C/P1 nuclease domain-containing protein, partial [Leptodontidium sp. 2 PMI_412]